MYNTKGQSGIVIFFILIIFGIIYFTGLSAPMANLTLNSVNENNITGVEGWVLSIGFQLMLLIFFIIALMAIGYFGLR